jgi:hypothetical protein
MTGSVLEYSERLWKVPPQVTRRGIQSTLKGLESHTRIHLRTLYVQQVPGCRKPFYEGGTQYMA